MERIGSVINNVIKNLNPQKSTQEELIFNALIEQLTADEKKHIKLGNIYKKNLILLADSTGWMYTLNLKKNQLLISLQEKFGKDEIEGIKLRIG